MWHVIGDPTLEMWVRNPYTIRLYPEVIFKLKGYGLYVQYEIDDAIITAFQETREGVIPIGRGVVKNGEASISLVTFPHLGSEIKIVANVENGLALPLKIKN